MSISENALHLREAAGEMAQDAIGASSVAAEDLQSVRQSFARVQEIVENTTQTAATLLGEQHPAVGEVTGSAAGVTDKVLQLQQAIDNVLGQLIELDGLVTSHAEVMQSVAEKAMGNS
jgi:hypothetical protein